MPAGDGTYMPYSQQFSAISWRFARGPRSACAAILDPWDHLGEEGAKRACSGPTPYNTKR